MLAYPLIGNGIKWRSIVWELVSSDQSRKKLWCNPHSAGKSRDKVVLLT